MTIFILLIWAGFFYCFVTDLMGNERPERWPGHRLRIH